MTIYQSDFLSIYKEGEMLIQSWTEKVLDVEDYKNELCNFMDFFHKLKPKELVIDVKKCKLVIPEEIDGWMAENVLISISKKGIKKLAFTIAENVKNVKSPKFECKTNPATDSIDIDLNIDSNDLPRFLTSMKQIELDNQFAQDHIDKYNTLTFREIEVLKLIVKGNTNKEIGQILFIEESSVKTHRKNIKQKLNITSLFDIYQFTRCFQLI